VLFVKFSAPLPGVNQQVLPGVTKLRVAGAVQEEIESKVGRLQNVGKDQSELEARRDVVTYKVVAEMKEFGRRHQHQKEDYNRYEYHR